MKKVVTFLIEEELLAEFKQALEKNDSTMSKVIRRFITEYVQNSNKQDII